MRKVLLAVARTPQSAPPATQPATHPATNASGPTAVNGLKCQVRPLKPKLPFNEWPRLEVTLTNVSAAPIDLIATAQWAPAVCRDHTTRAQA